MSEKILLALMQLFSIIVEKIDEEDESVRFLVKAFLKKQLSKSSVAKYLEVYDNFIFEKNRRSARSKKTKRTSVNSVKILLICTQINKELTQRQKIVVLIRLLEFAYIKQSPSELTLIFIKTVSETFHITHEDYQLCVAFIANNVAELNSFKNSLLISKTLQPNLACEQLVIASLNEKDSMRVIWLKEVNLFFLQSFCSDEVTVNGVLVESSKAGILSVGSSIRSAKIKPIYYSDVEGSFLRDKKIQKVRFSVRDLLYKFPAGNTGFHKANFVAESGDLIGIMGASGSGKSTMLNLLNGSITPLGGKVTLNGIDIYKEPKKIEGLIGHVSQDDLLIEELTVFQNLFYSAKLSFANLTDLQIARKVIKVLYDVGLYETRSLKVGNPIQKTISGGQRKRLNIALELIREPTVLFTDEPTSGLSSRDSEVVMDLLRHLTLKGKMIFVVIHQPASKLFKMFDKLLILDTGGHLIFDGNPVDSISYFKNKINDANSAQSICEACGNVSSEEIFDIIESKVVDDYGRLTNNRKLLPSEWYDYFKKELEDTSPPLTAKDKEELKFTTKTLKPSRLTQLNVFIKRDILSKLSNTQYLLVNLLEAPLLAFILGYFLRYKDENLGYIFRENENVPAYIFISIIVALFLGLTVSAEEIIKDVRIRKREKFLNLSRGSYLLSKVLIMFVVSAIQSALFVLIGNSILGIGNPFSYWLMIYSVFCFANLLGLNISSGFRSAVTIYILIPFLVIPQLLLSGVLVKFDNLNPTITRFDKVPVIGDIMTARWAYEALAVNQYKDNEFEKQFFDSDRMLLESEYKRNFLLPKLRDYLNRVETNYTNLDKPTQDKTFYNWKIVIKEIRKEAKSVKKIDFQKLTGFNPLHVTKEEIEVLKTYISKLSDYYFRIYKHYSEKRDLLIEGLSKDKESTQKYIAAEKKYTNKALTGFLRNTNDFNKIIERDGEFIRKVDLVYYTEPKMRTHFYAPYKYFFGAYIDTYIFNLLSIWLMTIGLLAMLYFEALKKMITLFELISSKEFFKRTKKNKESKEK